jgi:hypothetical protein
MQCSEGVDFEVEEGNRRCAVMRGLRRGVDDQIGTQLIDECQQLVSLPDVQSSMLIARDLTPQPVQHPTGIALGSEENCAMIAVNSVDLETLMCEKA